MVFRNQPCTLEALEGRTLFTWASYATLVNQDDAAVNYSSIKGDGVTVAVIDTGVDYTQPALGGGFGAGYKVIGGYDYASDDADPMDESGHGTGVAGIIAANPFTVNGVTYQGVAPDAKIVALRVGTESSISNANITKALKWIITNYATYNISVVNLSLGGGSYTDAVSQGAFTTQFKRLRELGIFIVAASGNGNNSSLNPISEEGLAYPAADTNVFAVGAVDSNDVITSWTQRGTELDLLAPGVQITKPKLGGGYTTEDGTSFASPYVAGAAALIKQANPDVAPGDIGSILMSSGTNERDGDDETGNTTTLQYSRLDVNAALAMTYARVDKYANINFGTVFDTALDSQGVLHATYYNARRGDVMYATRNIDGMWSEVQIIDSRGDVGAQVSIAVDRTGKVGIGYYDRTHTSVKYAGYLGSSWLVQTVDDNRNVGTFPSLAFDSDGDAYLAYYRATGGYLRLATMNRDTFFWQRATIDGFDGFDVGQYASVDVGEATVRSNGFNVYHTTVAVAYADVTNGDLKYARLDLDDSTATWYIAVVDDLTGVANIDLNLHAGATNVGLQAQIAYQDTTSADIKYAYRLTDWFTESVATTGTLGGAVALSFDSLNNAEITYYNASKRAIYKSTRDDVNIYTTNWLGAGYSSLSVALNERTGDTLASWLNRERTDTSTTSIV